MKKVVIQTILDISGMKGLKIHKLNNENIRCFEIPRNVIKASKDEEKITHSGIYFLVSEEDNKLYVGQTDNIYTRIAEHNRLKEFSKVIAFVSENNSYSRTFIDYLEWYYINELKKGKSWVIMNDQMREKKPNVTDFESPILEEIISNIDIMLLHIGIVLDQDKNVNKNHDIFKLKNANAIYSGGKIILLKGSLLPRVDHKIPEISQNNTYYLEQKTIFEKMHNQLEEWVAEGMVISKKDAYELIVDIKLSSPSSAANYAQGIYSCNGWDSWKNDKGQTLDKVYRQK